MSTTEHEHTGKCEQCGIELGSKPKRPRLARSQAKSISIRLPEGVTGADWDTLLEEAEAVEQAQPDTQYEQYRGGVARGKLIWCVLERFTGRV